MDHTLKDEGHDVPEHSTTHHALRVVHSASGEIAGRSFPIGRKLTLCRSDSGRGQLAVHDPRVSRRHAVVKYRPEYKACFVEDLGSTNGSRVDGAVIEVATPMVPGTILRVGSTIFVLEQAPAQPYPEDLRQGAMLGRSPALLAAIARMGRVAPAAISVLVLGETGTGKELAAALLHELSGRGGPFVAVNCAAVPESLAESMFFGHVKGSFTGATSDQAGFFRKANRGTLFLDEVSELHLGLQSKLLRVLESREFCRVGASRAESVDVRIIAASNVDLLEAVGKGRFRRDLYARLAGIEVRLPPLRERRSDIPLLAEHFLAQLAPGLEIFQSASFVEAMVLHDWSMNVRELRSVMQRLALDLPAPRPGDGVIELDADSLRGELAAMAPTHRDPTPTAPSRPSPPRTRAPPTRAVLEDLLTAAGGNVAEVARHLGVARRQVYRWLQRHELDAESYRP